jgi:hypothetical protein
MPTEELQCFVIPPALCMPFPKSFFTSAGKYLFNVFSSIVGAKRPQTVLRPPRQ